MLAWTVYISFLGVAALMLLPKEEVRLARATALFSAIIGLIIALAGAMQYKPEAGIVKCCPGESWIPSLGIHYHLAVDGTSALFCGAADGSRGRGGRIHCFPGMWSIGPRSFSLFTSH